MNHYIIFLAVTVYVYASLIPFLLRYLKRLKTWYQAEGIVEALIDNGDSNATPVVRFTVITGATVTGRSNQKHIPAIVKKGDQVTVFYNPDNFEQFFVSNKTSRLYIVIFCSFILLAVTALLLFAIFKLF